MVSSIAVLTLMTCAIFLTDSDTPVNPVDKPVAKPLAKLETEMKTPFYELELSRWEIYNDGTHPIETTKGINSALEWAKANKYKTFIIPEGTYLIAKGTKQDDPAARINMVSDMDLLLDEKTILKKEANDFEIYSVLYLGENVRNVTIQGGNFLGDREHHDYSKQDQEPGGTHEWGHGIALIGAENVVIDNVKIEKFTGDGIFVGGSTVTGTSIKEADLEVGDIDEEGNPIAAKGKIRTNNHAVTNFDDPVYKTYNNIHFWLPDGLVSGSKVDVYYYRKDGSFIKMDKQIEFFTGESVIPDDSDYFRAVFEASSSKEVQVERMTVAISKNVTIMNSDIGYNRRQGISLVGSDGVQIVNNHIHHTNGTAPQSGIDVEPGFYPGKNTIIKDNKFTDNFIQVVLAYGENALVEGNHFDQNVKDGVGVHADEGFIGEVIVKDNIFKGSDLTLHSEAALASDNQFKHSGVTLLGKNITFSNSTLVDTSLNVGNEEGQNISNVSLEHNGLHPWILYIADKLVHIQDVDIKAETKDQELIVGPGNSKNIYERLSVKDNDHKDTVLPAGTYNQCSFTTGELIINRTGKYILEDCEIKSKENLLIVESTYGNPDVTIKNSMLEVMENIGYGAAISILGAENFKLLDSTVLAKANTNSVPLIKIGPYGDPEPTNVFGATIKGNEIRTKTPIPGIDTLNAGTDAPAYRIENNTMYKAILEMKQKDINIDNTVIQN
nr:right-handed parallel beta-helix repeat-containing protein [Bacillus sp. FJAT-49711]